MNKQLKQAQVITKKVANEISLESRKLKEAANKRRKREKFQRWFSNMSSRDSQVVGGFVEELYRTKNITLTREKAAILYYEILITDSPVFQKIYNYIHNDGYSLMGAVEQIDIDTMRRKEAYYNNYSNND